MIRVPVSLLLGAVVTLGLFLLMQLLISHGAEETVRAPPPLPLNFLQARRQHPVHRKQRTLPPKPKPARRAAPPPPAPRLAARAPVNLKLVPMAMPSLAVPGIQGTPFLGALEDVDTGSREAELVPLVKIPPRYPRRAALRGKEGWVKLAFTVTETGGVKDVKVIDARPKGYFERAARRAVLRWRFRPKVVDGHPVPQQVVQVIEFRLEEKRR